MIKNYVINFMDKTYLTLTAEEAAKIGFSWQKGGLVIIRENMYATHQIVSIKRVDKNAEKDLCDMAGINQSEVKTIGDYLPKKTTNLLN